MGGRPADEEEGEEERDRASAASPQPKSAMRERAGRVATRDWAIRARGWTGQVAAWERNPMWY